MTMFTRIFSLAIYPIIGAVFHPAYIICNTIIFKSDPDMQAALGLGGFALSIFLLSLGVTFNDSLDTLISQSYGAKEYRMCRLYLNRQLYMTTIVFFVLAIPLMWIEQFLIYIGQTTIIAE